MEPLSNNPTKRPGAVTGEPGALVDMGELAPYAGALPVTTVTANDRGVTVAWQDGGTAYFHYLWLRDHCACAVCRHPQTRERLVRVVDLPDEMPLPEVGVTPAGALRLVWPAMPSWDTHESLFDPGWLRQRADAGTGDPLSVDRKIPWNAGLAGRLPEVGHAGFMGSDAGLADWLHALDRYGIAVLRGGPAIEDEVLRVAERVGWARETNFGHHFDVVSKPNPNNAAYTALALDPHSDLTNWQRPPDFQLLYCLANDARGGDSLLIDGYAVAEALKADDPEAFRLLNELAIDFRFQDETVDIACRAPVIDCDEHGKPAVIRFNNWLRDSLRLSGAKVEPYYRAYRKFWNMLRDPCYTLRFKLRPGEMIAFDNLRVLHGRDAFDPDSGRRHFQGVYLDRDLVRSRLRVLARDDAHRGAGS